MSPVSNPTQSNSVALITGASRGIGRGIALELAAGGFDLALNFRSNGVAAEEARGACLAAAEASVKSIRVSLYPADISIREHREELIASIERDFGRLDLLVNNAGIAPTVRADLLDSDEESFDHLLAVNLKAPFFLTQLAARWMLRLRETFGSAYHGKIVTISSISAYTASVNRGDYCVSKAGLSMLTRLFAARLAGAGINVYEVRPGIIATEMTAGVKEKYDALIARGLTPIQRWGEPRDVGRAVAALALGAFPFSTGEVVNVDGGFHLRQL
jgi:NAD(P)-dependent dehydrogenase (short-subunit alcohol dehydrogenase family)